MELREYLKILQKNLRLIIITTILAALFGYLFTLRQTSIYEASGSLMIVPKSAVELRNVYEYDGFYALQAASLFGNTIASWLSGPDTVIDIYKRAGLETGQTSSRVLSKLIKATPPSDSFSVKFQLANKDKERALKLAKATIESIQNKTTEFNQKAEAKANFEIAAAEPAIIEVKPKKELNSLIGALAGLILGIFLAFVREYFRAGTHHKS